MKPVWFWFLPLAIALTACSNLGEIQRRMCGNRIVEAHEDCDVAGSTCGQPTSGHPCRFICNPALGSATGNCPTGYSCGSDGVCRAPTGDFSGLHAIPAADGLAFSVGDVDGDYSDDVVRLTRGGWVAVDFLDSSGLAATTRSRSMQFPFALGKLTAGDNRIDIAHLPDARLDVLTGESNRTLLPHPYAGIPIIHTAKHPVLFSMNAVDATPADGKDAYDMYGGTEAMVLAGKYFYPLVANQNLPLVSESSDTLAPRLQAGGIPVGQLDDGPESPCDEFVLADAGATSVSVYSPCSGTGPTDWSLSPLLATVSLPSGAHVGEGVILAHVNPDPYLDLVIAGYAPKGNPVQLYVAYGLGDGTFNSTPPPLASGVQPDSTASPIPGLASGLPLAAGDLNGDGIDDFVFKDHVAESNPGCFQALSCWTPVLPGLWSQAAIGDFNANKFPDIVAIPEGARYVEFYNGTGGGLFNKSSIQTNGYPTALTIGDFDGDLIPDVAVAVASDLGDCPSNTRTDHLSIMFGALAEPPGSPVSMGNLGCISQIAAGNYFFAGPIDWTTDLAVLEVARDGTHHVALFPGSTDRQLYAPYPLNASDASHFQDAAVADQVGRFDQDNSNADIAVLGLAGENPPLKLRLWNVPVSGDAEVSNASWANVIDPSQLPLDPCSALAVSANLDGGHLDELALLGRSTGNGDIVAVAGVDPTTHKFKIEAQRAVTDIPLVQPATSRFLCSVLRDYKHPQQPDTPFSTQVQPAHLVDQKTEQIVALGRSNEPDAGSVLRVFSWAGPGHDIKEESLTPPADIDPVAFTVLDADKAPARKLVLATIDGVYISDLDYASLTIGPATRIGDLQPVPQPIIPGAGIDGLLGIAWGDFNGDGVRDIAVGSQSWLDLFYGIPTLQ